MIVITVITLEQQGSPKIHRGSLNFMHFISINKSTANNFHLLLAFFSYSDIKIGYLSSARKHPDIDQFLLQRCISKQHEMLFAFRQITHARHDRSRTRSNRKLNVVH